MGFAFPMTHRFLASLLFLLCLGVIAASVFAIVMAAFHYAQLAAWNELPEVIVLFTHSPIQGNLTVLIASIFYHVLEIVMAVDVLIATCASNSDVQLGMMRMYTTVAIFQIPIIVASLLYLLSDYNAIWCMNICLVTVLTDDCVGWWEDLKVLTLVPNIFAGASALFASIIGYTYAHRLHSHHGFPSYAIVRQVAGRKSAKKMHNCSFHFPWARNSKHRAADDMERLLAASPQNSFMSQMPPQEKPPTCGGLQLQNPPSYDLSGGVVATPIELPGSGSNYSPRMPGASRSYVSGTSSAGRSGRDGKGRSTTTMRSLSKGQPRRSARSDGEGPTASFDLERKHGSQRKVSLSSSSDSDDSTGTDSSGDSSNELLEKRRAPRSARSL